MPIVRCSFTPCCQNVKILKINFYDVITSVLYWNLGCQHFYDVINAMISSFWYSSSQSLSILTFDRYDKEGTIQKDTAKSKTPFLALID